MEEESFPRGGKKRQHIKFGNDNKDKGLFSEKTEDESFPRGGKKGKKPKKFTEEDSDDEEENLFSEEAQESPQREKKGKNKKLADSFPAVTENKKTRKDTSGAEKPHALSYKELCPGMLLLGCVKAVRNFDMVLGLPNGLTGNVSITNISQAYTETLQRLSQAQAEGHDLDEENVHTLSELFSVGMLVPCKLLEHNDDTSRRKVVLTVDPREVNQSIASSSLKNNMSLYGSICSREDHGYTVDLGVKGVKAFLKNKDAESYIRQNNSGNDLMVGQCLKCRLSMKADSAGGKGAKGEVNRVVNVVLDSPGSDETKNEDIVNLPYSSLVPGKRLQAKVEKIEEEGLVVSYRSGRGLIHMSHLSDHPNTYAVGREIICGVLFINPATKTLTLTKLPHLLNNQSGKVTMCETVAVGQVYEDAKVNKDQSKHGVYFKLGKNLFGFATMKNLSDTKVENVKEKFQKGSVHRARVLDYQPLEDLALVTTKQSVLDQKYMTLGDIQPGDLVHGTILKIMEKGVLVNIQKGIQGFIPLIQLADVTLKHPEKKFKVDQNLKCRVLTVNLDKSSLTLTHKKSLLQSKLPRVSDYSQIQRGQILEGFICSVKDFGVHVRFYGNVQGLVPRSMLSTQPIQFPEKVFYRGQVVRSRVVQVDPEAEKLKLSLVLEDKKEFGQKEADAPEDFEIGKFVECKVLEKTPQGLDVELQPSLKKAFLPKIHLSDTVDLCNVLLEAYVPGDVIERVMYLNKTNVIIVTRKRIFLEAAEEGEIIHDFDKLQPEMEVPCLVKNVMTYGVFVQLAGQLFGLVPNHLACDRRVPNVRSLFPPGQSGVARIVEVNKEKERFLATLRMADCCHGDSDNGVHILDNYFADKMMALKMLKRQNGAFKNLSKMQVGRVCRMTVTEVSDAGVLGDLQHGVKVNAISAHVEGDLEVGATVECVVLDIDVVRQCVEVSLLARLVKELGKKDAKLKVKKSLSAQGEVLLVKREYVLFKLKAPAAGQLVYLPNKRHLNDVLDHKKFHVGEVYLTVVESMKNTRVYVSLKGNKLEGDKQPERPPHLSMLEKAEAEFKPSVGGYDKVKVGQVLQGLVVRYIKKGIIVRLGPTVHGVVPYQKVCAGHILVRGKSFMQQGTKVSIKVLEKSDKEDHMIELSMFEEDTGVKVDLPKVALKPIRSVKDKTDPGTDGTDTDDNLTIVKDKASRKRKTSETKDLSNRKTRDISEETNKPENKKKKSSNEDSVEVSAGTELSKSSKKTKQRTVKDAPEGSDNLTGVKTRSKSDSTAGAGSKKGKAQEEKKNRKHKMETTDDSDSGVEIKIRKSLEPLVCDQPCLELPEDFSWVTDFKLPTAVNSGNVDDDSDDSDVEDKGPLKKSKAEVRQQKLEEEKRLYELERRQLEGDMQPETADDFDRLVLQSPDSSLVWLRYMAFQLETSEIDKARAVAERALKTISFREEQEKLNVWVAYLNLENMYGSAESLGKVLGNAVQQNDPIKVNLQMINIYQTSGKTEEAEQLFNGLVKKHSGEKDLWIKFGQFYFDQGRPESARKLLQRSLKSLPTKFHVETISKFAQYEFKLGEPERGKTMFENILSTYPSRTDLWSVYIDMVIKLKDNEATRALFNRVISTKMAAKKMKFFFKKYLTFEEQHGSADQIAEVRKRALEYVESQGFVDE